MTPELISLLSQIPLVGIFGYFVLVILQRQSAASKENHSEWRQWLSEDRLARQAFTEQQNQLITSSLDRMRDQIAFLQTQWGDERAEMLVVLRKLQESTEHLNAAIDRVTKGNR